MLSANSAIQDMLRLPRGGTTNNSSMQNYPRGTSGDRVSGSWGIDQRQTIVASEDLFHKMMEKARSDATSSKIGDGTHKGSSSVYSINPCSGGADY
jgi:hypothetical protein